MTTTGLALRLTVPLLAASLLVPQAAAARRGSPPPSPTPLPTIGTQMSSPYSTDDQTPPPPIATPAPTAEPTSRATAAPAVPHASAPATAPLLVAPAGFDRVTAPSKFGALKVRAEWLKIVGKNVHLVFAATDSVPEAGGYGDDTERFVPSMLAGMRKSATGFELLASRPQTLCSGRRGHFVHYLDHGRHPVDVSLVVSFARETVYTAFYEHDLGVAPLAAGVAAIDSLCPPRRT